MITPDLARLDEAPLHAEAGALATAVRTLDIWPGCSHALSRAEEVLVATPTFQRLRRLRQMGLAFHAWPNAENTRASHSLGVAYWSARYFEALRRAPDGATQAHLASAAAGLERLSLEVVLRLFALLHDIELLPLGHTLRYQSALFHEHPGEPRRRACVAAIKAHAQRHAFRELPAETERQAWLTAFERHLDAAADALADPSAPHARLMTEIVNSGVGADLVDFALRDSFAITRAQALNGGLDEALRLVDTPDGCGLALDVSDPSTAARRVAMADDLYLARLEVFAASVFHPVKLAADAMLDLALRRVGAEAAGLLSEDRLLTMGDDELLARLAPAEAAAAGRLGYAPVTEALQAGRLHQEVWRTEDLAAFSERQEAGRALVLEPAWRTEAEAAVGSRLGWDQAGDVIVAVSPATMQAKPANARFVEAGGSVFTLAEAAAYGYANQAGATANRYERLWSLRVYVSPRRLGERERAAAAAAALFGKGG